MPISSTNALPRETLARLADYLALARNWRRRQPISLVYHPTWTTHFHVHRFVTAAEFLGHGDTVTRHLLGATLQCRFPGMCQQALNSATLLPAGRDFLIGDTAFHVAIAPRDVDIKKCRDDLQAGRFVYLLVPDGTLMGVQQDVAIRARMHDAVDRIVIESVEAFISSMIEWQAAFDGNVVAHVFASVIDRYNQRLSVINANPSLFIQLRGLPLTGGLQADSGTAAGSPRALKSKRSP